MRQNRGRGRLRPYLRLPRLRDYAQRARVLHFLLTAEPCLLRLVLVFEIVSAYPPAGDQPQAIEKLTGWLNAGTKHSVLLGVTGSGKTFSIANVIKNVNRPTLVMSHNKTLAAQLYAEFKSFFPNNAVEYFVSYFDYYQPEAYFRIRYY